MTVELTSPPYEVYWMPGRALLTTRLRGRMGVADVSRYEKAVMRAIAGIPPNTSFLWLSSALGYDAMADRAAHDTLRTILPRLLAASGLRTSMFDLFPGADFPIAAAPRVRCRAVAHVHHDAEKMRALEERLGRENERYFSAESAAEAWLLTR
jgi:hypothetical protein